MFGGCNFSCLMCPQGVPGRESSFKKVLDLDLYKKIIDDCLDHGLEAVSLHGSGEPTLSKDFIASIEYAKSKGLSCYSFTNGLLLDKSLSERIVDSGLDFLRISVIGYDRESYKKWMHKDVFDTVLENAIVFSEVSRKSNTELHSYHLITDNDNVNYEIEKYRQNWVNPTSSSSEIWMMHNWSGVYSDSPFKRKGEERSCGRPFNDVLEVRAGGIDNRHGAVVACCMTLGDDSSSVLGHLDESSISDVVQGDKYEHLRNSHLTGNWNDIDSCKGCDQLYETPEALVWTNIHNRKYGQSKGILDLKINNL